MTDPPGLTALLPENLNVADGLRAWLLPAWIRDCISGKKVVDAQRTVLGQRSQQRFGTFKSTWPRCDDGRRRELLCMEQRMEERKWGRQTRLESAHAAWENAEMPRMPKEDLGRGE